MADNDDCTLVAAVLNRKDPQHILGLIEAERLKRSIAAGKKREGSKSTNNHVHINDERINVVQFLVDYPCCSGDGDIRRCYDRRPPRWHHSNFTVMHLAAKVGHLGLMEALLDACSGEPNEEDAKRALINAESPKFRLQRNGPHKSNPRTERNENTISIRPLHCAVKGNQPAAVQFLLDHGAPVNELNDYYCSALHMCAIENVNVATIRTLLQHPEVQVDLPDDDQWTPFFHFVQLKRYEGALLVEAAGANIHQREFGGLEPICVAAFNNNIKMLHHLLLKRHVSVTTSGELADDGMTPLIMAAQQGNFDAVRVALAAPSVVSNILL